MRTHANKLILTILIVCQISAIQSQDLIRDFDKWFCDKSNTLVLENKDHFLIYRQASYWVSAIKLNSNQAAVSDKDFYEFSRIIGLYHQKIEDKDDIKFNYKKNWCKRKLHFESELFSRDRKFKRIRKLIDFDSVVILDYFPDKKLEGPFIIGTDTLYKPGFYKELVLHRSVFSDNCNYQINAFVHQLLNRIESSIPPPPFSGIIRFKISIYLKNSTILVFDQDSVPTYIEILIDWPFEKYKILKGVIWI